jgi:UDP-N-acetylglucosamine 1-carboxyvinyltransferase
MDRIKIRGGNAMSGQIKVSGAKNSVLPIMAAAIMTPDLVMIENVPSLMDVHSMSDLIKHFGAEINHTPENGTLYIKSHNLQTFDAPYDIVRKMRASVLVLGPLLARFGKAIVSLPGGCAIGTRPIDLHLSGLKEMGAHINIAQGYVDAHVNGRLKGADITFNKVSVGATENLIMAACLAEGNTTLNNAACEPEISDLCNFLNKMGAQINGAGTRTIKITGVDRLHGCSHRIIPDRIEAATYLIAAAITKGNVELTEVRHEHLESVISTLESIGAKLKCSPDSIMLDARNCSLKPFDIQTAAYPGIPTDVQAQFMALMTTIEGESSIQENVFENRFMHVAELLRMGADIEYHDRLAKVRGVKQLRAAPVMATDLRASVSLILAALVADGESYIHRIYHLDRGYEAIEKKLSQCGIDIVREKSSVLV